MTAVDLRDEDVVAQRLRRSEDRSASINNSGRAERNSVPRCGRQHLLERSSLLRWLGPSTALLKPPHWPFPGARCPLALRATMSVAHQASSTMIGADVDCLLWKCLAPDRSCRCARASAPVRRRQLPRVDCQRAGKGLRNKALRQSANRSL